MLPKIALVSGLRKFRKFCKIKVVSEEWAKIPIVYIVDPLCSHTKILASKGQIISKRLFGILGFFQKTNEQIRF